MELNDKNCKALLLEWQKRLGLQDWVVVLRYNCSPEDMECEDAFGETSWTLSTKNAVIRILHPDKIADRIIGADFEKTLVHELLHLKFGIVDLTKDNYEGKVVETVHHQLVDDMAKALIRAKRGTTDINDFLIVPLVKSLEG